MSDTTKLKEKIRALLAKAQGTEHAGEAAVFLAKAQDLMEKNQIELFELGEEDPIGVTLGVQGQPGPLSYKPKVQAALAQYYGARPVLRYSTHSKFTVELIGPESARITTELMTEFVWEQVKLRAVEVVAKTKVNKPAAIREVAKALVNRIAIELQKRKPASEAAAGTSLSLVVLDAVQAFMDKMYSDIEHTKGRKIMLNRAAMDAAQNISLHQQTGDRSRLSLSV